MPSTGKAAAVAAEVGVDVEAVGAEEAGEAAEAANDKLAVLSLPAAHWVLLCALRDRTVMGRVSNVGYGLMIDSA